MYVCLCNGITDRQIAEAVAQGARSIEALRAATGCGSQCGSCLDHAAALIPKAKAFDLQATLNQLTPG